MFKIILRALLNIVVFVIAMPVRIWLTLVLITNVIVFKVTGILTVKESWDAIFTGAKESLETELHWIKTGEFI